MPKVLLSGFVSYAQLDSPTVERFLDLMRPRSAILRDLDLDLWWDRRILTGHDWKHEILSAIEDANFGLLCLTPNFLDREFIAEVELPPLLARGAVFPVAIEPIDFERADLRGLDALQVFHFRPKGTNRRLAFSECAGPNRTRFCDELVAEMVDRLTGRRGS